MNPETAQILWYIGFAVAGYLLRHLGVTLPTPQPVMPPALPTSSAVLEALLSQLNQLLKALQNQQPKA
jgi:hypothetical protein